MATPIRDAIRRAPIGCLAAACFSLLAARPLASQQEVPDVPPAQTPVFTEQVEVNVVNLYVTVVDRKGEPVQGLTAADFRIEEAGQPMEITNFSAIGTVEVGISEAAAPAAAAPAAPSAPPGAAQRGCG